MGDLNEKIKEIKRYIDRTKIPEEINDRYTMLTNEWRAICEGSCGIFEATGLAFQYGQAKGYRAAAKVYGEKRGRRDTG